MKLASYVIQYKACSNLEDFPTVTLKLLMKPFRTFTKSFAKEEVTEKNLALPRPEMARTG